MRINSGHKPPGVHLTLRVHLHSISPSSLDHHFKLIMLFHSGTSVIIKMACSKIFLLPYRHDLSQKFR